MGYFSNGSEGCAYESKYCENCIHWVAEVEGETKVCPVWDIHMLHNYNQGPIIKKILGMLIPQSKVGFRNEQCKMFIQVKSEGQTGF